MVLPCVGDAPDHGRGELPADDQRGDRRKAGPKGLFELCGGPNSGDAPRFPKAPRAGRAARRRAPQPRTAEADRWSAETAPRRRTGVVPPTSARLSVRRRTRPAPRPHDAARRSLDIRGGRRGQQAGFGDQHLVRTKLARECGSHQPELRHIALPAPSVARAGGWRGATGGQCQRLLALRGRHAWQRDTSMQAIGAKDDTLAWPEPSPG